MNYSDSVQTNRLYSVSSGNVKSKETRCFTSSSNVDRDLVRNKVCNSVQNKVLQRCLKYSNNVKTVNFTQWL